MSSTTVTDDTFIPVAVSTLIPSTVTPFSLFARIGAQFQLFRDANFPFDAVDRDRLIERGIARLYVSNGDLQNYKDYLRSQLDDVLADESLPVRERLGGLNEVVRNVLQEDFASGDADQLVCSARVLADQTVQAICSTDAVASDLFSVMHHDYQTFTHSANVTYLSVFLASELQFPTDELRRIAIGALLHDLGKLQISEQILNKNGRLDIAEFAMVQKHPTIGFEELCLRTDLVWGQLMMVYQHHEDWAGGGYPVGSVGTEIHPWARICTIADVFEALTSHRPYRQGMSTAEALALMSGRMHDKFEPEFFQCFQAAMNQS